MPGRNAVFRLLPWNSLRCVGFSLLYSVCKAEVWNKGPATAQGHRTEAVALGGLELVVLRLHRCSKSYQCCDQHLKAVLRGLELVVLRLHFRQ